MTTINLQDNNIFTINDEDIICDIQISTIDLIEKDLLMLNVYVENLIVINQNNVFLNCIDYQIKSVLNDMITLTVTATVEVA